ncbi:hypothetical protein [Kangiella sediminilitoris]|uniref:Uncharacterized protein n=1 Tax=Kangiella sediminilitoris TaxID=1144748 RepID=A0A1B3B9E5_9GAMM|nr:hypothetical protein [Kangiella sediminilitoris]AOE49419.1 hypothetical protein KS2013_695 [Kangiella sediminilitoris]
MNYRSMFKGTKLKMLTSAIALALTTSVASADEGTDQDLSGVKKQTSAEAFEADVAILSREKGVDKASVARAMKFQEKFESQAAELMAKFPNKISRIWLEPAPSQMAHIQFVGRVPAVQLPANVSAKGGGRFSLQENIQRAEHIADVLKKSGKRNFMTYFDARTGKVKVEMAMPNPAKGPNKAQVLELLQRNAKRDLDMPRGLQAIAEGDIDLDVIQSEDEIYTFEHSRGGNWLRDDGFRECTSG